MVLLRTSLLACLGALLLSLGCGSKDKAPVAADKKAPSTATATEQASKVTAVAPNSVVEPPTLAPKGAGKRPGDRELSTVSRFIETLNTGQLVDAMKFLAEDCEWRVVGGTRTTLRGTPAIKSYLAIERGTFPDLKLQSRVLYVAGGAIVAEVHGHGTQTGEHPSIDTRGASVGFEEVIVFWVGDKGIRKAVEYRDELSLRVQIGLKTDQPVAAQTQPPTQPSWVVSARPVKALEDKTRGFLGERARAIDWEAMAHQDVVLRDLVTGQERRGLKELATWWKGNERKFPKRELRLEAVDSAGDSVVARLQFSERSGRSLGVGIALVHFSNAKIKTITWFVERTVGVF